MKDDSRTGSEIIISLGSVFFVVVVVCLLFVSREFCAQLLLPSSVCPPVLALLRFFFLTFCRACSIFKLDLMKLFLSMAYSPPGDVPIALRILRGARL
jgi:predicted neutral ceramidase superfamily lipid hydrolase